MKNQLLRVLAQAGAAPPPPASAAPITVEAVRQRNTEIVSLSTGFKDIPAVRDYTVQALADPSITIEQYKTRILALMGNGASPIGGIHHEHSPQIGGDRDDFIAAASDALVIRAGMSVHTPHPGTRDLRNAGILAIARYSASRAGISFDTASSTSLIKAALSTSDFPLILEHTVAKALRNGYEAEPRTYETWTRLVQVPNFNEQSRVILGSAPEFKKVVELGDYEDGPLDEDKSLPYKVEKFGRIISLSWEAMKNDDVGAFLRVAQGLGQAAARKEADLVYSSFADNSGAGPEMQDGKNLFHSDHNNLATAQASLTAEALAAGRVLLRRQTAIGGGVLNLPPRFLLVPPELEHTAEILLAAAGRGLSQGANNQLVPNWMSTLELVVEPRLTAGAFYLLTTPDVIDTYERAHLEGERVPDIVEVSEFEKDAHRWRARHTFGGRWLDWRGAVRIPLS